MRYLNKECEFEGTLFMDCIGKRAEACLYATVFGVPECVSIESFEPFVHRAKLLIGAHCPIGKQIATVLGCFQDYFRYDATIIYINCTELNFACDYLDEGPILNVFLSLCSRCIPGSHCVVVTFNPVFNPALDYGVNNIHIVYQSEICRHTEDECHVYICRIMSDMQKHM